MAQAARARSTTHHTLLDLERLATSTEGLPASERLQPPRLVEGSVTTDAANRLRYAVATAGSDGHPPQLRTVTVDGAWHLTREHELSYRLHQGGRMIPRTVTLRGAIVQAGAHQLVFALRHSEREDLSTAQRLSLSGRWQADAGNRLTFLVEQSDGTEDRLTLGGGWVVGPHHELLYRYRQGLREQTLAFAGRWDVLGANRLVYRLFGSTTSAFEFSAGLQSRSLQARDGRLVYQVGIRLSRGRLQQQRIVLHGSWKWRKNATISFEVPYADGRVEAILFEAQTVLGPRRQAIVRLRAQHGQPWGMTLTLTQQMTRDAQLFLQLRKDAEERSVIGGVRVRF